MTQIIAKVSVANLRSFQKGLTGKTSSHGFKLLFRYFGNVQLITLRDITKTCAALLNQVV